MGKETSISSEERRTMQFVVERDCPIEPGAYGPGDENLLALCPFPVWVEWPNDGRRRCGGKRYWIPQEEAHTIRASVGLKADSDRTVCEHMGYLCE